MGASLKVAFFQSTSSLYYSFIMFSNLCESTNTKLINDCWDNNILIVLFFFYAGYKMFSLKYGSLRTCWNSSLVQNWWCPNVGLACYCNISIRITYNTYIQSEGSSVSAVLFSPKLSAIRAIKIETLKGRAWVGTWPPHPCGNQMLKNWSWLRNGANK